MTYVHLAHPETMSQRSSYPSDPQVVHGASFVLRSYLALATPDTEGAVLATYDPGSCCARTEPVLWAPRVESPPRTSGIRTWHELRASAEDSGLEVVRQGLGD